jgi:predicted O-methyltransferase YrrM
MTNEPDAFLNPQVASVLAEFHPEDETFAAARANGDDFGSTPISATGGATLRFVAAATKAKTVVEIGTGSGMSGLYLLRGLPKDAVLTTIDVEPEHHRAARRSFVEAGFPSNRTRFILGQYLEVLPRLTDGGYDLVIVNGTKSQYPQYLTEGIRLLRAGGVLAFTGTLHDPAIRSADATAVQELLAVVAEHPQLAPVLLPVGDGLLLVAKV